MTPFNSYHVLVMGEIRNLKNMVPLYLVEKIIPLKTLKPISMVCQ